MCSYTSNQNLLTMFNLSENIKESDYFQTITIKKTKKGHFYQKFDDEDDKYQRISKKSAIEKIENAREQGRMLIDKDIEFWLDVPAIAQWIYTN